jgi:hypothetical protein
VATLNRNTIDSRRRRGVGTIIGGVILTAIILTSVLVFFVTILNNEKARTSYEIQSSLVNQDKEAETLTAVRATNLVENGGDLFINTRITNNGSLSSSISQAVLYCVNATGCPNPNNPAVDSTYTTLNAGEGITKTMGPVDDGLDYRVDFITERGNIVSTVVCTVDETLKLCVNDTVSAGAPDFSISVVSPIVIESGTSGISMVTVTSIDGFNSEVILTASPLTSISASWTPDNTVSPPSPGSANSNLTISASNLAAPGTYTMFVNGTSGVISHTAAISITILDESECVNCAVTEGIIQGTGSLQLDFKAFGVLFPKFQPRTDNSGFSVDQSGWEVVTSSSYGSATGYPGFDIPTGVEAVLVEKARNMDLSGNDIKLNRNSALQILAGAQGAEQGAVFLCKEDKAAKQFLAYDEEDEYKILPWTPLDADRDENWQELFFCASNPADDNGDSPWIPTVKKWSNLNGILMIARGAFEETHEEYAQTVPYQAVSFGNPGATGTSAFIACPRDDDSDVATDCTAPTNPTQGDASISRYSYTVNDILNGKQIYIHLNNPSTGPYAVSWLYSDGNRTSLFSGDENINDNLGPIELPEVMADGGQIQPGYYTIIVTDSYGPWSNSDKVFPKNVFYITFQVRP